MTTNRRYNSSCAACRFSRRCCSPDCPLAPYFPASQPQVFQHVHRLYGTGKIVRIQNLLKGNDRKQEEAMLSIKYESFIRHINPVDGCYGAISYLKQKLVHLMSELQCVRSLLDSCRRNNRKIIQDSVIASSPESRSIYNDQSVGGLSNSAAIDQTIDENYPGFNLVGLCDRDRNANEALKTMEPPLDIDNWADKEITNDDLMRILYDSDEGSCGKH
ncbi:hypothetical protein LXL04_006221 [Taraxacum kok-saghyz]